MPRKKKAVLLPCTESAKMVGNFQLRVSGSNLLGSISSHADGQLIALPDNTKLQLRTWSPKKNTEHVLTVELDEEASPPIFIEWGKPAVCPSFLAVAGPKLLQVFQVHNDPQKITKTTVLTLARYQLSQRPVGLSWHPSKCMLAVFDNDKASLLDLSSPSKGAVLVNTTTFTVAGALKCGTWAKPSPRAETSAEDSGILALAGASELNLFSVSGGSGDEPEKSKSAPHRCFGSDHRGAHEIGNFRTIAPLDDSFLSNCSGDVGGFNTVLFAATLDAEMILKAIGEGLASLLTKLPNSGGELGGRSLNDAYRKFATIDTPQKYIAMKAGAAALVDTTDTSTQGGVNGIPGEVLGLGNLALRPPSADVVDLRGRIGNEGERSSSSFLLGNILSQPEGLASKSEAGKSTSVEGARVSIFALVKGPSQDSRLRVVASSVLPSEIQSPDLLAILPPPTSGHCGLIAVTSHTSSKVALFSVVNNDLLVQIGVAMSTSEETDLLHLSLLDTFDVPGTMRPKGISLELQLVGGNSIARLSVLCAKRNTGGPERRADLSGKESAAPMPTSISRSPTVSYDTVLEFYECPIPLAGKQAAVQRNAALKDEVPQSVPDDNVRSQIRAQFITMLAEEGNESDDDNSSPIPVHNSARDNTLNTPEDLPSLFSLPSIASSAGAEEIGSASTSERRSSLPGRSKQAPIVQISTPRVGHVGGEAAFTASSLTTMAIAIGSMEEKLSSRLNRLLEITERSSTRIASLEAHLSSAVQMGTTNTPVSPIPPPPFNPAQTGYWVPGHYVLPASQPTPRPDSKLS